MIDFETSSVVAHTINDAWRDSLWLAIKRGHDFVIKGGSYEGQIRRQLETLLIKVLVPSTRPLSPILPAGMPMQPTTDDKIEKYLNTYLLNPEVQENEDYTYGNYIEQQFVEAANILNRAKGDTNQCAIAVCEPKNIYLKDPPCLRQIMFKVIGGALNMSVIFRSWDLVAGLPENLGGMQRLKEEFIKLLDFPVVDGKLIAFSDGAHIYDQYFDMVNALNIEKIYMSDDMLREKQEYNTWVDEHMTEALKTELSKQRV